MRQPFTIVATWDDDAGVWVAESDDVPGLVTEAETTEALMVKLKVLLPELLEANGAWLDGDEIPFTLRSNRSGIAHFSQS